MPSENLMIVWLVAGPSTSMQWGSFLTITRGNKWEEWPRIGPELFPFTPVYPTRKQNIPALLAPSLPGSFEATNTGKRPVARPARSISID